MPSAMSKTPAYRGFVAWRSIDCARSRRRPSFGGNETGLWLGRDVHLVHYPIAGGRLLNVVAIERRPLPVEGWATRAMRAELLAHLAGASPAVKTLLVGSEGMAPLVPLRPPGQEPSSRGASRSSAMLPTRSCPSSRKARRSPSRTRPRSPAS